jgi:hypothetical protein
MHIRRDHTFVHFACVCGQLTTHQLNTARAHADLCAEWQAELATRGKSGGGGSGRVKRSTRAAATRDPEAGGSQGSSGAKESSEKSPKRSRRK